LTVTASVFFPFANGDQPRYSTPSAGDARTFDGDEESRQALLNPDGNIIAQDS